MSSEASSLLSPVVYYVLGNMMGMMALCKPPDEVWAEMGTRLSQYAVQECGAKDWANGLDFEVNWEETAIFRGLNSEEQEFFRERIGWMRYYRDHYNELVHAMVVHGTNPLEALNRHVQMKNLARQIDDMARPEENDLGELFDL